MTAIDRLIPTPRIREIDHVELAAPPERVWERVRHGNLATSPLVRGLFALRTLPERLSGHRPGPARLKLDDIQSSTDAPGFQILADAPPREVAVGAIGKVWQLDIPFLHVDGAEAFERFRDPGWVKVAWTLRTLPLGENDTRLEIELRVDATDDDAWKRFRRYFRLVGPGSHFIRRSALATLERELGNPRDQESSRPLPGDALLPDAADQLTHAITIEAPPEQIWPWLVQLGCRRAGYYSLDLLDNAGVRSAREIHPDLQALTVGDVVPGTRDSEDGFEVLAVQAPRTLVLGGLYDPSAGVQRPFASPRPERYWQVTWAFVLEPLDHKTTRLLVRARAAFPSEERLHVTWIRPVHRLMQTAQLRNLKARAEGRVSHDDWRDVLAGLGGAAQMALALATPFRRSGRARWGVDAGTAARLHPGDERVAQPRWGWTHGIEIAAPAEAVWGWIAQIGVGRGGFYSYQWLENLAGCNLHNAERVHPEWEIQPGDPVLLHPKVPPLFAAEVARGRYFLLHAPPDDAARAAGKPWVAATWLFLVEPLGPDRCRLVSRYRCDFSGDLGTRLAMGSTFVEPVGFAMDRRMLRGVKARAEATQRKRPLRHMEPAVPIPTAP